MDSMEEIETNEDCDPQVLEEFKKQVEMSQEAADYLFSMKSWCENKFFVEDSAMNKQFGIHEELDYIE
ncbi:meiotic nuclear division protein 1 homolog [Trichonephila inaurata madagascariensis]|uniref:Meiotic nuclear division protein 1 homolog n=1 Tax=Trichonephila inaurata madagascariensis TaxID=2747483 RepID=A0A8X7C0Q2_9ARAC|nr:meiotic nuclear division protein 1 homolog [Trichonephila inaurata madagascariensis]